ncbi:MAG TPA: hypothetical protein VNT99_20415 [Methylomirabilota bacterium]|nr:hypothetical protein [Methylomirabilota bacterium]
MNPSVFVCFVAGGCALAANAAFTNFVNFETAPVHPITLGPDGQTLAVCNLPDNRVELFDVSSGVPVPIGSVAVGLDPVTARFASSNELWVVNHISSTISIVDLAARNVIATLETPAGPSDLVFTGSPRRAWVTCSRTNAVFVIDPITRAPVTNIVIAGERPRALAASPDGSKIYVAIFESGNGTTILGKKLTTLSSTPTGGPVEDVRGPYGGVDPPPNSGTNFVPARVITNPPPRVSHIVRKNSEGRWMDDNNGDWTEWISGTNATNSGRIVGWDLPDRDVAIIDTLTHDVSYAHRLMNLCMGLAVNPASGEISVVGTDGTNEKRFEPVLNGVFLRVNLALVDPLTRTNRLKDLNPHLEYIARSIPLEERALGISDPRGIEWNAAGTRAYITGMGSRNLIIVDASGERVNAQPIELGEGPTGLALDEPRGRLYVWNRFSSSIAVVDTETDSVVTNVPVFDPTPDIVRKGRRHLFDTRNSGLGIVSCASCHPDVRMDRLAWDLGDPAGLRVTNSVGTFHPMKGPMVTQTLQDIIHPDVFNGRAITQQVLHWRGDRRRIEEFNPTFVDLLARDTQLSSNEMAEFRAMLSSISYPPNPLRTFSNSLPASVPLPGHFGRETNGVASPLPPGNPSSIVNTFRAQCGFCHGFNSGRSGLTNPATLLRNGTEGVLLFSQLRSLAEKLGMDGKSTNSRTGFGFMHDGRVDTLTRFMIDGFPQAAPTDQSIANFVSFMLCFSGSDFIPVPSNFSQDVPASVGRQVTFSAPVAPPLLASMFELATRTNSRVQLALRGKKDGLFRHWLLRRATGDFQSNRHGEMAATLDDVIASAAPGNEFTATLVPEGTGVRLALDRDGDGYFDMTEMEMGYDPANAASHPGRIVSYSKTGGILALTWESAAGLKYTVEWTTNPPSASNMWSAFIPSLTATTNITGYTDAPPAIDSQRFYRIRKEP